MRKTCMRWRISILCSLALLVGIVDASAQPVVDARSIQLGLAGARCGIRAKAGSPEGVETAPVCTQYLNITDGQWWRKVSGTGNTGWVLASAPAGSDTQVQFNDGGAFGADSTFTFNKTTDVLGVNNIASQAGTAFTLAATAPASGGTGGAAGVGITATASHAVIGSGAGYNAGGSFTFTAGNAVGQTSGNANGGGFTVTTGNAAGSSGTPSAGSFTLTGGAGVNGLTSAGGSFTFTGGAGSPGGSFSVTGGAARTGATGGSITLAGGGAVGGASSTTSGSVTVKSGDVQNTSGTVTITTGAFPASYPSPGTLITIKPSTPTTADATSASTGAGVSVEGGPGQANTNSPGNATAGTGGVLNLLGGIGGNVTTNGNTRNGGGGGALNAIAGDGGNATGSSGTRNGGNGGDATFGSGSGGTGATSNGSAGVVIFKIGTTEAARFNTSANFGIGTGATVSARLHAISTTEQLRLGYDASNYLSATVGSSGGVTFDATGSGAAFTFSDGVTLSSSMTNAGATLRTGVISPTQLTADTDNWNPTGLATANVIRIDVDAAHNLTGLAAQASGTMLLLYNTTAFTVTLKHDVTSTAANRFYAPGDADYSLTAHESVWIRYDGTHARWTIVR